MVGTTRCFFGHKSCTPYTSQASQGVLRAIGAHARRRERYDDPVNLFELMPKLRLEMEPALATRDRRPIPPTCVVVVHKKIQEDEKIKARPGKCRFPQFEDEYRKRPSLLKSSWPVGRPLGVGAGRLLPRPSTLGGIVGNDGASKSATSEGCPQTSHWRYWSQRTTSTGAWRRGSISRS